MRDDDELVQHDAWANWRCDSLQHWRRDAVDVSSKRRHLDVCFGSSRTLVYWQTEFDDVAVCPVADRIGNDIHLAFASQHKLN